MKSEVRYEYQMDCSSLSPYSCNDQMKTTGLDLVKVCSDIKALRRHGESELQVLCKLEPKV